MNNKALTVLGIAIIGLLVAIFVTLRKPSVSLPGGITPLIQGGTEVEVTTTPIETVLNNSTINMPSANTEYPFIIPKSTVGLIMQCRDGTVFRYSFFQGRVGSSTPSNPYYTVQANGCLPLDNLNLKQEMIMYVACGSVGKILEAILWCKA